MSALRNADEMPARLEVFAVMPQQLDIAFAQVALVALDDGAPTGERGGVAAQLREAEGRLNVGHVALPPGEGDVVLPGARAVLRQRVLRLAVQRLQHEPAVQLVGIERARAPCKRASFGRRQVLHGVKREGGEVGHRPGGTSLICRAERVGGVG